MHMAFEIEFLSLLFLVAALYAAVGHGGASGYLALMAIFNVAPEMMKPSALLLNLFVSTTALVQFYRAGYFRWRHFWPFILTSVPFSFAGGLMTVEGGTYKKMLGAILLIPVMRFLFLKDPPSSELQEPPVVWSMVIGAVVGLLSGMLGIGGGIILSPLLIMLHWEGQKGAAALSAGFILVNSVAGLSGQFLNGLVIKADILILVAVAFAGGLFGAYLGALRFQPKTLRYILAGVLVMAVVKLFTV
jgi:uncharacterized protein